MLLQLKRLLWHDDRVDKANAKLEKQYDGLDELDKQLDDLTKKLDTVEIVATETTKSREQFKKTVSTSQMEAVKPKEFDDQEAITSPGFRRRFHSGT